MNYERSKWLMLALAVFLAAGAACSRKSSGSNSGARPAFVPQPQPEPLPPGTTTQTSVPQDYTGRWRLLRTANTGNGACDTLGEERDLGIVDVDASGLFSTDYHQLSGVIDLGDGDVSFATSDPEPCGAGAGTGRCVTEQSCTGNWAQNGEAPHSGTWRLERL